MVLLHNGLALSGMVRPTRMGTMGVEDQKMEEGMGMGNGMSGDGRVQNGHQVSDRDYQCRIALRPHTSQTP